MKKTLLSIALAGLVLGGASCATTPSPVSSKYKVGGKMPDCKASSFNFSLIVYSMNTKTGKPELAAACQICEDPVSKLPVAKDSPYMMIDFKEGVACIDNKLKDGKPGTDGKIDAILSLKEALKKRIIDYMPPCKSK